MAPWTLTVVETTWDAETALILVKRCSVLSRTSQLRSASAALQLSCAALHTSTAATVCVKSATRVRAFLVAPTKRPATTLMCASMAGLKTAFSASAVSAGSSPARPKGLRCGSAWTPTTCPRHQQGSRAVASCRCARTVPQTPRAQFAMAAWLRMGSIVARRYPMPCCSVSGLPGA